MKRLVAVCALIVAGCASAPPMEPVGTSRVAKPAPTVAASAWIGPETPKPDDDEGAERQVREAEVQKMLARVSKIRGLPIKRPVPGRIVSREEAVAKIKEQVERDLPKDVMEMQGEVEAGLGLVPFDYDYAEGIYRLLQGQIAGFYDPKDKAMFLLDDLWGAEERQTLSHELVHALQDQSFPLDEALKFKAGESDRISAGHAVIEGDATSAMFDEAYGPDGAFNVEEEVLDKMMRAGALLSTTGLTTPRAITESLVSAYTDGFAFVQNRRRKGGFAAVDEALAHPPASTEQLLHPEKYDAHEAPLAVPAPSIASLGAGFQVALEDVSGEQDLRITLGQLGRSSTAARAAAGWGGDRYVVAAKTIDAEHKAIAFAWRLRMDTTKDAKELADHLKEAFQGACKERPHVGPIAWRRKGDDVAIVAGPWIRGAKRDATSKATCKDLGAWIDAIFKAS